MIRPGVELALSSTLSQEAEADRKEPQPNLALLRRWASALDTEVHWWCPRLWLVHSDDSEDPRFIVHKGDTRSIRAEVKSLEQGEVTRGIAAALHEQAESRRRHNNETLGRFAMMVGGVGSLPLLYGVTASEAGFWVPGAILSGIGGAAGAYTLVRPFEPRPLPELPDIEPAVIVAPRT